MQYCFFDESPGIENLRFIGKIDSKVSGDDIKWNNDFFGSQINPERNYHFSALSVDVKKS